MTYVSRGIKSALIGGTVVIAAAVALFFVVQPLAHFKIMEVTCEPGEVLVGNSVAVTADIENQGYFDGKYQAQLIIQGNVVEQKTVAVPARSQQTVSFYYTPVNAGTFTVTIGEASASFTASEGVLPAWYNGDSWTYEVSTDLGTSEITYEVLGESVYKDAAIYVIRVSGEISSGPFGQGINFVNNDFVDKETLSVVEEERSGIVNSVPVYRKVIFGNVKVDGSQWPLKVGNTWKVGSNTTVLAKNGLVVKETTRYMFRSFTVEGVESITTEAGVFRCFKIVERNDDMDIVCTSWYADQLKREAKYELIDEGTPFSFTLVSYRVQAAPPPRTPKITIQESTKYTDPTFGYTLYYPTGWKLASREGEQGIVDLFTTATEKNIPLAGLTVIAAKSGTDTLDEVYTETVAAMKATDAELVILTTSKVPAELPWYDFAWESNIKGDPISGTTFIVVKDNTLYIASGWVQKTQYKTIMPGLRKIMNSIGISTSP